MNLNVIHPFIHEFDFPITSHFTPYIPDIIQQYVSNVDVVSSGNIVYENEELRSRVQNLFWDIIRDNFETSSPIAPLSLRCYVQNDTNFIHRVHNHISTATISAVFYLQIPKVGGGIRFYLGDDSILYLPKPDKIVLFPSWLYHSPTPQKDNSYRICVNLEFPCVTRPILKNKIDFNGRTNQTIRW